MKTLNFVLVALFVTLNVQHAEAARPDRRQRHQNHRIRQGVRSGELTRDEAKDLRRDQRAIRKEKHEMRSDDGRLDREERSELRQDQNAASKEIYEEKHDE